MQGAALTEREAPVPHLHDLLARDAGKSRPPSSRLSADAAPCLTGVAHVWRELADLAATGGDDDLARRLNEQADRTTARQAQLRQAALTQLREIAEVATARGCWKLAAEYEDRVAEAAHWLATHAAV